MTAWIEINPATTWTASSGCMEDLCATVAEELSETCPRVAEQCRAQVQASSGLDLRALSRPEFGRFHDAVLSHLEQLRSGGRRVVGSPYVQELLPDLLKMLDNDPRLEDGATLWVLPVPPQGARVEVMGAALRADTIGAEENQGEAYEGRPLLFRRLAGGTYHLSVEVQVAPPPNTVVLSLPIRVCHEETFDLQADEVLTVTLRCPESHEEGIRVSRTALGSR